jgi:hypothetical protein
MNWKEIIGKTIKSVDEKSAANVVNVEFTDGTKVSIDTEAIIHTNAGSIYRPIITILDTASIVTQEVQVVFSVSGYVKQTVVLNRNIPAKELQKLLNEGDVVTTIQENGEVFLLQDGMIDIGRVVSVDNNCEYEDFHVEEEIEHGEQE